MTTGIGIPAWNGESGRQGTSMQDIRLALQGLFHSFGVLRGATVTTSPTALVYHVSAGVGVLQRSTAYGAVIFPIPAGSPATTPGPSSGTRTDIVWAAQHDPSQGDTDGNVVLGVGQTLPVGAIELARFTVPAGMTTTSQATRSGSQVFAIPYGASMGTLVSVVDTFSGVPPVAQQNPATAPWRGTSSFTLPTDREVELSLSVPMQSQDGNRDGALVMQFQIDGQAVYEKQEAYSTSRWDTPEARYVFQLSAGTHTVAYKWMKGLVSMPNIRLVGAGSNRKGVTFRARDLGPVV